MVEEDIEFITFDGDSITKSDYRDEIINKYISANLDGMTKITDFTIGSEAYHLADVMASFILEHREMIDTNYRMSMIHTAEGEFLDNFGDMAGVHRIASSGSVGTVTFTRLGTDTSQSILIADGTQVSTEDAISFIVDNDGEDLILESGMTTITANVICEQEGAYTNVLENTIVLVMGDIGSLVSVTNTSAMTGGTDIEEDDDYRARILLSPYEVPAGSLKWYENTSLTASHYDEEESKDVFSVHDVLVEKGETLLDADITITFHPIDWTDTTVREDINNYNQSNDYEDPNTYTMLQARADLVDLFQMKEYDIVGITMGFNLAEPRLVLEGDANVDYYFAVLLETNYTLDMVTDNIIDKINKFNDDSLIGIEFNPNSIASIIENEVTGVNSCRIVKKENDSYTEVVETEAMQTPQLYRIDTTDIENRIKLLHFNLDIELEE